jgi:hypothetical protein
VKRKASSILGFLAIISIFLFAPAYIDCEEFIEADFLFLRTKYEDQAIENFSLDKQLNFTIVSGSLSIFSFRGDNPFDSFTGLSLQILSSDQKPLTLRC